MKDGKGDLIEEMNSEPLEAGSGHMGKKCL
jgi:hypothetical protein